MNTNDLLELKTNLRKIQDYLFSIRTNNPDKMNEINECHNHIIKMEKILWNVFIDNEFKSPAPSPQEITLLETLKSANIPIVPYNSIKIGIERYNDYCENS